MKTLQKKLLKEIEKITKKVITREVIYEQGTEQWQNKKGYEYKDRTENLISIKQDLIEIEAKTEFYINEYL